MIHRTAIIVAFTLGLVTSHASLAVAHSGHGTVPHDSDPLGHFLTSGSHMGIMLAVGVIVAAVAFLIGVWRRNNANRQRDSQ